MSNNTASAKPDNYMVPAILATIFCSTPTGIAAIVYAARVDPCYRSGDYGAAEYNAKRAKMWSWISIPMPAVWIILLILLDEMTV